MTIEVSLVIIIIDVINDRSNIMGVEWKNVAILVTTDIWLVRKGYVIVRIYVYDPARGGVFSCRLFYAIGSDWIGSSCSEPAATPKQRIATSWNVVSQSAVNISILIATWCKLINY